MATFTSHASLGGTTLDSLRSVISSNGSVLIMAYGYIGEFGLVADLISDITTWLASKSENRLYLFVGCIWDKNVPDAREKQEGKLRRIFETLFPAGIYEKGVGDQIEIHVIENFHAKFCLMLAEKDKSFYAVEAIIGSSNLSNIALQDKGRIELDLHLSRKSDGKLINSMHESVISIIDEALKREIRAIGGEVRYRCFIGPILDEIKEIELEDDFCRRRYYYYPEGDELGEALHESDVAQGIDSSFEDES